ncbi:CmcI family methyltransferase [Corallococcus sp. BB11-1]|uniref:CmcI family methyltransferase n=1 Tax=Corallococcus sp. BB11-1 TaxID=2996783 RepID=UPI00226FBE66|nr:CmcI family methyltransferase [Corallococcus sp. BB11-1]MCY1031274.1 CmcI family methyltransferase [Corallococcus sp. BB11-1]
MRLSSHVLFVDYGADVEVQHTVRGTTVRVTREVYEELLRFRSFAEPESHLDPWVEAGVLVPPFNDTPEAHGGLLPGTEAWLGRAYQDWYWRHEVEAEREYRWLGHVAVKMPMDLFFYQELLAGSGTKAVLEVGYGMGGGLWFFATMLALCGGGRVIGVDREPYSEDLPPFERLAHVQVDRVHGDAHATATLEMVRALVPDGFGLVVLDADARPEGKLMLLERWSALVRPGGYLVLEDVDSPACRETPELFAHGLDRFLLERRNFSLAVEAARFPLLKSHGAVFRRTG